MSDRHKTNLQYVSGIKLNIRADVKTKPNMAVKTSLYPFHGLTKLVFKDDEEDSGIISRKWYIYNICDVDHTVKFFVSFNLPGDHYRKELYEIKWLESHGSGPLLCNAWAHLFDFNTNLHGSGILTETILLRMQRSLSRYTYFVIRDERESMTQPPTLNGKMDGHVIEWLPFIPAWRDYGSYVV